MTTATEMDTAGREAAAELADMDEGAIGVVAGGIRRHRLAAGDKRLNRALLAYAGERPSPG